MAKRLVQYSLLSFAAVLTFTVFAAAQVTTADVVGRVTDPSEAIIQGALVSIQNMETGITRSTLTGDSGYYVINLPPPGRYTLSFEVLGFKTHTITDLDLSVGDRARRDVQMQVGQIEETIIEVVSQAPMLQTDNSSVGALVTENAVQDLPLNGRNYIELAQNLPGVNPGPEGAISGGTHPADRRQTSALSVNGQSEVLNNSLIDGMDNNERMVGTIGVKPSIDAIEEFRVQTNLYSAEVGRTAGGVVNIITKSGTNDFHGSLYEFFRNDTLNARNFFSTTGPKPNYRQHQFGGSIGGPIRKNRTFFFGDYEGLRIVQGITSVSTIPTQEETQGDFSLNPTIITDPMTGQPFPENVIPPERIDPIAAHYVALYPEPTSDARFGNYTGTQNRTQNSHILDVRIDHYFTDSDAFFTRYSFNNVDTFTPPALPPKNGIHPDGTFGREPGFSEQVAQNVHFNYLHIFGPKLLMELKFAYSRMNYASYPLNYGNNVSEEFGMERVNISPETSGLAWFLFWEYACLGDGWFLPIHNLDSNFQYAGSITYTRGPHNLKIGTSLIRRRVFHVGQTLGKGAYGFFGYVTGNEMADLLLGIPTTTERVTELVNPEYRTWESGFYIQDDWRVKPWLTLNLGIRYDTFTPYTEAKNQITNVDINRALILVAREDGVSDTARIKTDYGNLAPRFGFAATVRPGLVVRGGYGLTFFPTNYLA